MSLVQRLLRRGPTSHASEGKRDFRNGAADLYGVAVEGIDARVHGSPSDPYDVRLRWPAERSNPVVRAACSCPNFFQGFTCKHIWAVLYAVDEAGSDPLPGRYELRLMRDPKLLSAPSKLATRPPVGPAATMSAERSTLDPPSNGRRSRRRPPQTEPDETADAPRWLKSLRELRDRQMEAAREKPPAPTPDVLWYVIDLPMTSSSGVLTLQLCLLHTRRDGSQEAHFVRANLQLLRTLELAEDREIVALLQGMQPEERTSYLMSPRDQVGYRIDPALGEGFLQRVLATRRVTVKREAWNNTPDFDAPLRWDGDRPWSLQLEIVEVRGGKMWRLAGLLGAGRGRSLRSEADEWMASQEIRNPPAMTRLLAPGFPD